MKLFIFAFLFSLISARPGSAREPEGLLLTWQNSPCTTITIDWHVEKNSESADKLLYRSKGEEEWKTAGASVVEAAELGRIIFRVEVEGLEPDSVYEFRAGDHERVYSFQTLPDNIEEPLRFAAGGDVRYRQDWMEKMNEVVMEYDPSFIVWGGDLALADSNPDEDWSYRWEEFFDAVMNTLICEDGMVTPVIAGIGTHEVHNYHYFNWPEYEQTDEIRSRHVPFFYDLFAFPGQPGWGVLDIGGDVSFVFLDSAIANPVAGKQTEWLEDALKERSGRDYIIAFYHVPAFPSHRDYDGRINKEIREHWVPLFDSYGVRMAFECHDHAYKRSPPIKDMEINPEGTYYFGDGGWGVKMRSVKDPEETWYLEEAVGNTRHGMIVSISKEKWSVKAVSSDGVLMDEVSIPVNP